MNKLNEVLNNLEQPIETYKDWKQKEVEKLEGTRNRGTLYGDVDIPLILRTEKVNTLSKVEQLEKDIKEAENLLNNSKEVFNKKSAEWDFKVAELQRKIKMFEELRETHQKDVKVKESNLKTLQKQLKKELKK